MGAPSRDPAIDLLKSFSMIGVVMIHVAAIAFNAPLGSGDWLSGLFWGGISRGSVPIFFMCSGALLLPPEKQLTVKQLYTRRIPHILVPLFFWAFLYGLGRVLFNWGFQGGFPWDELLAAGGDVLSFHHEYHLYFLHILLLVYAALPVCRLYVRHADKSELRYLLLMWFVLGIAYPTVRPYWPFSLLSGIPGQWRMNMTYAAIGYALLGYALKKYYSRSGGIGKWLGLAGLGFVICFVGTLLRSSRLEQFNQHFLEGMSLGPFFLALGIFGAVIAWQGNWPQPFLRGVAVCARASFCVYLCHVFFLATFSNLGLDALTFSSIWGIPLVVALILLGSGLTYVVLSKIPWVRDWLI